MAPPTCSNSIRLVRLPRFTELPAALSATIWSAASLRSTALYFDAYTTGVNDGLFKLTAGSLTPTAINLGGGGTTLAGIYGGFKEFDNSLYFSAYASGPLQLIKLNSDGLFAVIPIPAPTPNGNTFAGEFGGFAVYQNTTTTAVDDNPSTPAGVQATGNVLTNDTDSDTLNQALIVTAVNRVGGPPEPVAVAFAGVYGHLTLNQDGSYIYAPTTRRRSTRRRAAATRPTPSPIRSATGSAAHARNADGRRLIGRRRWRGLPAALR